MPKKVLFLVGFWILAGCSVKSVSPPQAPPSPVPDSELENSITNLSYTWVSDLDSDTLKSFNSDKIQSFTPWQIPALKLSAFTPKQIPFFTPIQVKYFTRDQLKPLRMEQVQAFTPGQLKSMTVQQILWMDSAKNFTFAQLESFTSEKIKALWYHIFKRENIALLINKLSPEDFSESFSYSEMDTLLSEDLSLFPQEHLQALRKKYPRFIANREMENKDITQVEAARVPEEFNIFHIQAMSREQAQSLTPDQMGNLTSEQLQAFGSKFDWFSEEQVQALTQKQIQSQNMKGDFKRLVGKFSVQQMSFLTGKQIQDFYEDDWIRFSKPNFKGIRPECIKYIDPQILKSMTFICEFNNIPSEKIAQLTPEQRGMSFSTRRAQLTSEQMAQLTPNQLNTMRLEYCSQEHLNALTGEQIPFLNEHKFINAFSDFWGVKRIPTPYQMQFITVVQIRWFYPKLIRELSGRHIQAIRPEVFGQMQTLFAMTEKGPYIQQIAAFTPEQVPFFTEAQIQAMTLDQLAALTEEQMRALTPAQAVVFSEKQMQVLSQKNKRILNAKRNQA